MWRLPYTLLVVVLVFSCERWVGELGLRQCAVGSMYAAVTCKQISQTLREHRMRKGLQG
jgi:hypothetical protein